MTEFKIEGQTYKMVDSKFTFAEASAIEKVTGFTFQQIGDPEVRGSIGVVQALLWVSMKRITPELKFSDLNSVAIDDIEWIEDEDTEDADPTPPAEEAGEPSST